jgi:DNA-binding MarR family transcriptional regulator
MPSSSASTKTSRTGIEAAERLRKVVGRLGRTLRLTHVDGSLPPSQREVLATIVRSKTLRLSELAAEEGINPTMLSRILGHLEAAKLVQRTPDEADARVVHLAATEAGHALHDEMRNERTDALFYALGKLTANERRVILEALPVLETLVDSLRNRTP